MRRILKSIFVASILALVIASVDAQVVRIIFKAGGVPGSNPSNPGTITQDDITFLGAIRLTQSGGSSLNFMKGGFTIRRVGGVNHFIVLQDSTNNFAPTEFVDPAVYDDDGNFVSGTPYTTDYTTAPQATLYKEWSEGGTYDPYHGILGGYWESNGTPQNTCTEIPRACIAWTTLWHDGYLYVTYGPSYGTYYPLGGLLVLTLDNTTGPVTNANGPFILESPGETPYPTSTSDPTLGISKGFYLLANPDDDFCHGSAQAGATQQGSGPDGPSLFCGGAWPTLSTSALYTDRIVATDKYLNYYTLNGITDPDDGSLPGGQAIWSYRFYNNPYPYETSQGATLAINPSLNGGVGTWSETSAVNSMTWIHTATKTGVIANIMATINHLVTSYTTACTVDGQPISHSWYCSAGCDADMSHPNGQCEHGCANPVSVTGPTTTYNEWEMAVFSENTVSQIKLGSITDYTANPDSRIYPETVFSGVVPPLQYKAFGGSAFDPASRILYVLAPQVDYLTVPGNFWPVIYAFYIRK